jgi:hypothetical protein
MKLKDLHSTTQYNIEDKIYKAKQWLDDAKTGDFLFCIKEGLAWIEDAKELYVRTVQREKERK